ncbi:hypothetical protein N9917_00170 [Deltaproteobacteria bacterium]|nr:hypothetical protein [Deltaproteobacteria bacterium]
MSDTRIDEITEFLEQRLDAIVKQPPMWGDPFAVENGYLHCIEFLWVVECGKLDHGATRAWTSIIHEAGYLSNVPLAHQEGLRDNEDKAFAALTELLPKLREYGPVDCPKCDGLGYQEWLTGCDKCGQTPPCESEDECPGPDETCGKCRGTGRFVGKREPKPYTIAYHEHGIAISGPIPLDDITSIVKLGTNNGYDLADALLSGHLPGVTMVLTNKVSGAEWRKELGLA